MTREEHIPQHPQREKADDEGIAIEGLILLEELPSLTQGSKMLKARKRILHIQYGSTKRSKILRPAFIRPAFEEQIYVFRGVSRPPSQHLHHT